MAKQRTIDAVQESIERVSGLMNHLKPEQMVEAVHLKADLKMVLEDLLEDGVALDRRGSRLRIEEIEDYKEVGKL